MFKAVFDTWDSNQDGAIQKEQLGSLVKACGMNPSESELNDLVADLDTNKNGVIEFDEFLSLAAVLFKHGSEEILLRQAFAVSSSFVFRSIWTEIYLEQAKNFQHSF